MCSLTEKEVESLVKRVELSNKVYEELKRNYDGHRFSIENEDPYI